MCDYQATQKGSLTSHHLSAHMARNNECKECGQQFCKKHNLAYHPCKQCDYQASNQESLTTHQLIVHVWGKN